MKIVIFLRTPFACYHLMFKLCSHTTPLQVPSYSSKISVAQPSPPYIYARDELLDGHFPIVVPCFFSATEALCQRFFYRTYHFNANNIQNPFTNINYVSKRTTYRGTTFFGSFLPQAQHLKRDWRSF